MRLIFSILVLMLCLLGCGTKQFSYSVQSDQIPAGEREYRYALTLQVLDDDTLQPLKDFTADLVGGNHTAIVLNGLGNKDGIVHISRKATQLSPTLVDLPFIVSAPGFETSLQMVQVGSDCEKVQCSLSRPVPMALKKLSKGVAQTIASSDLLSGVAEGIPATQAFNALVISGKIDPKLAASLSRAKAKESFSKILVLLDGVDAPTAQKVSSSLLSRVSDPSGNFSKLAKLVLTIAGTIAPLILSGSPDFATVMVAVNSLVQYLSPIASDLAKNGGPVGKILGGFLSDPNFGNNLMALLQGLKDKKNIPQLAFTTFLPIIQRFVEKLTQGNKERPFLNLILGALKDPRLLDILSSIGKKGTTDKTKEFLLSYLQPLIQGLLSKSDPQLANLFNSLIGKGGVASLESLPADTTRLQKFAKLLPYLDPILSGLKGKDAVALKAALTPLLNSSNPAEAIQGILTQPKGADFLAGVGNSLFPGIETVVKTAIPQKQLFASQLMQGLLSKTLSDLRVEEDISNSSAVVISASASDLIKIAGLPNVSRISFAQ